MSCTVVFENSLPLGQTHFVSRPVPETKFISIRTSGKLLATYRPKPFTASRIGLKPVSVTGRETKCGCPKGKLFSNSTVPYKLFKLYYVTHMRLNSHFDGNATTIPIRLPVLIITTTICFKCLEGSCHI